MTKEEIKQQLQSVFEADYPGIDIFIEKVIRLLFVDDEYIALPARKDILADKDAAILEGSNIESVYLYGEVDTFVPIKVYDITIKDNANIGISRVGIQKFVRQHIAPDSQAFMLFHYRNAEGRSWRFSYLYKEFTQAESTNAKRYTYLFGRDHHARTAVERFSTLAGKAMNDAQPLLDAFSVQKLSDDFFDEYNEHYLDFVQYITGKRKLQVGNNKWEDVSVCEPDKDFYGGFNHDDKRVRDYVKKMMGRLVFLCFLQRKGWMGNRDMQYMQNLYRNSSDEVKADFLDSVLEPMFFGLLNTKSEDRADKFRSEGWDISLITDAEKIPYLNGGLFEQDSDDAENSVFPCLLFSNPDAQEVEKKYSDNDNYDYSRKRGVLDFFAAYNFTIDENDPDDAEVGVDPEMLSRIFENLLEDNKDKGAFYTPKEIVQYMCRESLIAYLTTCVVKEQGENHKPEDVISDSIRELLDNPDKIVPKMNPKSIEAFGKYSREVKICDPAIGSGAFPMGLLNELVRFRKSIGAWGKDEKGNLLVCDNEALKTEIICNNIYGVDIEKGAVDIARLRFWLSIIVDAEEPHALPNFDYKFMQGNSLIPTFCDEYINIGKTNDVTDSKKGTNKRVEYEEVIKYKKALYELKQKYYASNGEEKLCLGIQIKDAILNLIALQIKNEMHTWVEAKSQTSFLTDEDTREQMQYPPEKQKILDTGKAIRERLHDETLSLQERAQTDIHFFDWRIMFTEVFDVKDTNTGKLVGGFDIVIGNPPYIRQERLGMDYKKLLTEVYPTVGNGTADILVYFFGLGLKIMKRDAVLAFITSNKFLKTKYGKELRNTLAADADVRMFIDFFELPVFHNASTDAGITILQNQRPVSETKYFPVLTLEKLNLFELTKGDFKLTIKDEAEWKFIKKEELSLMAKICKDTISLGEFVDQKIYSGIKTACNDAFVLDEPEVYEDLLQSESKDIVVNYAKSTDIGKWNMKSTDKYFLATGFDLNVPDLYPTAYRHLQKYEEKLRKRQDQGRNWYNLRACAYYEDFEKEKIIYIHTAKNHQFYFDTEGRYINNSCYMIISDSRFLFCFLNSRLFDYFKRIKFVAYGNGETTGRCKLDYNKMVTVPIKNTVNEEPYKKIVEKIRSVKNEDPSADVTDKENQIDRMLYELYGLTNGEVKIINPDEEVSGADEELFKAGDTDE